MALESRGGAFKSNLSNADVWDGTSTTDWTGAGYFGNPYLITKASQLAGLSEMVNAGTTYYYTSFKLGNDLDMNGDTFLFTPIGSGTMTLYFDGDGHTISNLSLSTDANGYNGLFRKTQRCIFNNLNIEYIFPAESYQIKYFGGLCGDDTSSEITNVNVSYSGDVNLSTAVYFGGLIGRMFGETTITNCQVSGLNIKAISRFLSGSTEPAFGGIAGDGSGTITNCKADINVANYSSAFCYFGGILGKFWANDAGLLPTILGCYATGTVTNASYFNHCSGIASSNGYDDECITIKNCLTQFVVDGGMCGVFNGYGDVEATLQYNIVNSTFTSGYAISNETYDKTNIFNSSLCSSTDQGATTDTNMKLRATYADWTDFDTYWVIDEKINNGYPMLKKFIEVAKVTGFEGRGTETSPYLVKTHQDLLGLASYYNDNDMYVHDIYWQLANDIDVSKDANNILIHFTPICYNKSFDGYFDGNNMTISGLLIDNQYEYTGLFGTIASNHWVKDLTVKGDVYWDEAYAVGGVAGRVLVGGYIQNCHYEGNIIGVLNTKPNTECNGVVGKLEINGAIDCTANYTDLKYAKIGGTSDAPTYTYYLYDWAQIKTYLYDKKV